MANAITRLARTIAFCGVGIVAAAIATAGSTLPSPVFAGNTALSSNQIAQLARGEAVVNVAKDADGASGRVDAVIDIPAPPDRVWATMMDCARAEKFVENLKSCRIVQRDPNGAWEVREHIVSPSMLLPDFRSVFHSDYVLHRSIKFRQIEGDLSLLEGEWRLVPEDNGVHTRLYYTVRVGTDLPVPDFIVRSMIETDAPKTLVALRTEVMRVQNTGAVAKP